VEHVCVKFDDPSCIGFVSHCATFGADRSNRCQDMAIFDLFFKRAVIRYLEFVLRMSALWTTHDEYVVIVIIIMKNLVGIGAIVSIIYKF